MKYKEKYSIGDMSRICNVSKKALRYYDKIGLITSQRQDYNNYRYYTGESLLSVPVLKYYKQMGFTLEEMREFIEGKNPDVYNALQTSFLTKLEALRQEQQEIQKKYTSVKDWYDLIQEAQTVINNNIHEVSVKYMEPQQYLYQEQDFEGNLKAAIINLDWTNYIESLGSEITGPVVLQFPDLQTRFQEIRQKIAIMQRSVALTLDEKTQDFGGCMMATCYHIGPHETLALTYRKISRWSRDHGYHLSQNAYERYVTDYWTTRNTGQFVTEVMIQVRRKE